LFVFIRAFTGESRIALLAIVKLKQPMNTSEDRLHAAINRILRTWSLIKMVPEHRLSALRPSLMERLSEQRHMTEDELVVVGLKYLHQEGRGMP
jgi:hypothetical protein